MDNKKFKRYGIILYYLLKIISRTLKVKVIMSDKINLKDNYVCGFWHNKLIGASLTLTNFTEKRVVLASASKDGELIAVPLEKLGFTIVRGSSGKDSIKSVLKLIKLIKLGYSAGTPLDGPKGPVYEVKPGMIYLAQKSGKAVVPIGISFSKKWVFKKTWDKFQLPKPFSKLVCIIGDPIFIPEKDEKEEYINFIKEKLMELDRQAEEKLF